MKHDTKRNNPLVLFAKMILLALFITGSSLLMYYAFGGQKILLPVTNSISLDAKLYEARIRLRGKKLDTLVIGSSMALNNFSSETFFKHTTENKTLYNFAAWGLNMKDSCLLLDILVRQYHPRNVIMLSNYIDFRDQATLSMNELNVRLFLLDKSIVDCFLIGKTGFLSSLTYRRKYDEKRIGRDHNDSLFFDDYGSVPLDTGNFNYTDSSKNNKIKPFYQPAESQYEYLEKMIKSLSARHIQFSFIQTPFRCGVLEGETPEKQKSMSDHFLRTSRIVSSNGGIYFRDDESYSDRFFIDIIHMNATGAAKLTDAFFSEKTYSQN